MRKYGADPKAGKADVLKEEEAQRKLKEARLAYQGHTDHEKDQEEDKEEE